MYFALGAEWFFDVDEAELLEIREPVLNRASAPMKLFLQPPIPKPARVGTHRVEPT